MPSRGPDVIYRWREAGSSRGGRAMGARGCARPTRWRAMGARGCARPTQWRAMGARGCARPTQWRAMGARGCARPTQWRAMGARGCARLTRWRAMGARGCARPTRWRAMGARGLVRDVTQDQLAMPVGVAVHGLQRLRALLIEMEVVLPREADPAVDLERLAADAACRLAHVGLRHGCGQSGVGCRRVEGPGRVVDGGVRVLDLEQHLGALVADGLGGADGLAALIAALRIPHAHVEEPARCSHHLARDPPGPAAYAPGDHA